MTDFQPNTHSNTSSKTAVQFISADTSDFTKLTSEEDLSVNWVSDHPIAGKEEARFVRRTEDYFIVYLSSQTGCKHACRFCHLTQTGQTDLVDLSMESINRQAIPVFEHYDVVKAEQGEAKRVHFNFMARGEPLANPQLRDEFAKLHTTLCAQAEARGLEPHFKISTIMPESAAEMDFVKTFAGLKNVAIYYSLYSFDTKFRKRWLPKAMNPHAALDTLTQLQQQAGTAIVIHGAFIKGENDSVENAQEIVAEIKKRGLKAKFNLVRYNPYSDKQGEETDEAQIQTLFETLKDGFDSTTSRIVPRVGFDVKASCGMFVS